MIFGDAGQAFDGDPVDLAREGPERLQIAAGDQLQIDRLRAKPLGAEGEVDAPLRALNAPGRERRLRFERERDRPDRTRLAVDPRRVLAVALEKPVADVEGAEAGTAAPPPERQSAGA